MPVDPTLLTIADIMRETGFDRTGLGRYLDHAAVKAWLGGGTTHPLYPASTLPQFLFMYAQKQRGIKPAAFAIACEEWGVGDWPGRDPDAEIMLSPSPAPNQMALYGAEAIANAATTAGAAFADALIERLRASQVLPPVEDRFLSRDQAAALLACSPGAVGRRVKPVLRETWSHLDIQEWMRQAREGARAKAQAKAANR